MDGQRGNDTGDMKTFLYSELDTKAAPSVIIIHLGSNDLIDMKTAVLYNMIKKDILELAQFLPNCVFIWSDLLPRLVQLKMKRVNREGRNACLQVGVRFIERTVDQICIGRMEFI